MHLSIRFHMQVPMANAFILFSTHRLQSVLVGTSINVALSSILNTDSLE